ncbi:MAG: ABC transporter ATP-binding protein [Hungatella hathewayi]|nr:ABC transporter ATP-binding protein [Hungatella hathewayi]
MKFISKTHGVACYRKSEELNREITVEYDHELKKISDTKILELKNVKKYFPVYKGIGRTKIADVKALDDISFSIYKGETLGLVGESGCGKTTLAKTILRIYNTTEGKVLFNGRDITGFKGNMLRKVRSQMQFIFQDPFGSLDPRQTCENIIGEPIKNFKLAQNKAEYDRMIDDLCAAVGLDLAMKQRVPHEFSGGQRQRISIARTLASNPSFIICDEPISALDVSIQAQVINLLIDLQKKRELTYLFIAHDLSVVRHISDRIMVMYLGKIVEISPAHELYERPLHPYTQALLSAVPIADPVAEKQRDRNSIRGEIPSLINRPSGCVFHNRCPYATDKCKAGVPEMRDYGNGHSAACFYIEKEG